MRSKRMAWSTVAVVAAFVGCSGENTLTFTSRNMVCPAGSEPPCETTEPAGGAPTMEVSQPDTYSEEPTTATYVVNVVDLPVASGGSAAGFNLDGIDSGGGGGPDADCQEYAADFTNSVEPDLVGVDNALQNLVTTIEGLLMASISDTLQEQIEAGSLLLLVRVSEINDFQFDPSVQLQFYLGEVPGGGTPEVGGDGRLVADQEFAVAQMLGPAVEGDIFQGRLRARTSSLTITVDTGDFILPLNIVNPEVRFDISATGLTNGQIGGYLRTEDIIETAGMLMEGSGEAVRGIVENVADVEPSSADPTVCESLSVGLTFGATTASCSDC